MNHRRGATLVLVTHDHELAAEATRRISLRDGRVVSDSEAPRVERPEESRQESGEETGEVTEGAARS